MKKIQKSKQVNICNYTKYKNEYINKEKITKNTLNINMLIFTIYWTQIQ